MMKVHGFIKEVRKKPYSIILFDEIEKAHPDVINVLLQILDDGRLTDNFGRITNFKNTIIIMTSNVGGKLITNNKKLGFQIEESQRLKYKDLRKDVLKEAKDNFSPEFLNRIDEIIVFQKLNEIELKQISSICLNKISKRMKNKNIEIIFDENVNDFIVDKLDDDTLGARPIRRIVQDYIQDKIVNEYLDGNIKEGDIVNISQVDKKIYIKSETKFDKISEINEYV